MRSLFIVISKLLGILSIYWALLVVPHIGFSISVLRDPELATGGIKPELVVLSMVLAFVASLLLGLLLLFKTERLADFLKVSSDITVSSVPKSDRLLQVGLILIGIYILINVVPEFIKTIIESFQYESFILSGYAIGRLTSLFVRIAMAVYLVIYSKRTIQIITKYQRGT